MARIEGEILIERPVAEVFDYVADERHEPAYNAAMLRSEKVTDGPIGVGTRFRATVRQGLRPVDMEIEFTEYDRPRLLASTTDTETLHIAGTLTFGPAGSGTRMGWTWDLHPRGLMRALAPLVTWIGRRQEQRVWSGLKRLLESGEATAPGPDAGPGPATREPGGRTAGGTGG